jgi:hypothetical protein
MTSQAGDHPAGEVTMLATVALFCIRRRRWVLVACTLLVVAGIVAVNAAGSLGHPAATLSAHLDPWVALRRLLAFRPHW